MKPQTADQLALCEAIKYTFLKHIGDSIVSGQIDKKLHDCLSQMRKAAHDKNVPLLTLSTLDKEELEFVGLKEHGEYMLVPSWLIPFVNTNDQLFFIETGEEVGIEDNLDNIYASGGHTNIGLKNFVK